MNSAATRPDLRKIGGTALLEVLATLWSWPATLRNPNDPSSPPHPPRLIRGLVHLAGPRIRGSVRVQLPPDLAARAIRRLTGLDVTPSDSRALLEDMAGELANMVAGRVAEQLAMEGYPSSLDTPKNCAGSFPGEAESGGDQAQIEVLCENYWLSLELQCRYADP
jgi:CheY-specific phosphatase CheX